ncbi:uncharacterized protein LOC110988419 [Acanthaster planci]|uniref:Uncharacterized protein LOC110988419 n=1 Tax=Acanthaster planci TaxID=133434 RepID=A0A8B7ZVM0_ACAPL|nr:uncharacterized protein LOC110988419 [Acanthaster planci]XP_022107577.1 uncharacterized protein LOC110988419 [Acanthaster planci]
MAVRLAVTAAFLFPFFTPVASVDLTVTPGAVGPEVVEATVQRILLSDIFSDDFSLLRRIALVETADGKDSAAFAGGLAGGIWRLTPEAFTRTTELAEGDWGSYYTDLRRSALGVDWRDVTYTDLQTPLISALAARIYIMMTSTPVDKVAYGLAPQALYWKLQYNKDGDEAQFIAKVTEMEKGQVCKIGIDVVFALDASLSVGDEGFARSKNFVKQVVEAFNIGPRDDQTRVGCLQFSHEVSLAFDLDNHDNKEGILRAVDEIAYKGGGTAMGSAIDFIRQNSFTEEHGARPTQYAVPRVAVILTDGKTNKEFPILFPSALAHRDGITIYCIGVGAADDSELTVIASRPVASHVMHVLSYAAIDYLQNIMATRTCRETTEIAVGHPVVTDLQEGEARFISYEIDRTEGATLKFVTSSGLVTVYLSSEVPNPNEAVYDYKVQTDGRVDLFIDPALLGSSSRYKRATGVVTPSHVTVYTAIYAHTNGTQLYVESRGGNNADHGYPPPASTDPPDGGEHAPYRSHASPGPTASVPVAVAAVCATSAIFAQLQF